MALAHSTMVPLGTQAPDFSLPGTDGKTYSLDSFKDTEVLVIIFMCNHCPYVKAVLPRLIDLQNKFEDKSVQIIGINSNDAVKYPDDSMENMKKIAKEKNIPFPYLFDETQAVAKTYDAVCTPDIYVFGPERKLLYRGRIDDNWEHPEQVTRRDLEDAINAILDGQPMLEEQIPSMGCSIKWK
ncbi:MULTISPECIES: thioredoxin family protein [unclassified Nitrospina]|uniref:thioredoxin family protein n=1 Tax=unclassified Nitrospina TaxID=2638683 RepID=UPI003F968DA1